MRVLNADLIDAALRIAEPAILSLLDKQSFTWGPKWAVGYVSVLALGPLGRVPFRIGKCPEEEWDDAWGIPADLSIKALHMNNAAIRERCSTSDIAATRPWCLEPGETFHPGGIYREGIVVAVSGAKDRVNEAIAEIIMSIIRMLSFMEKDYRVEQGKMNV